MSSNRKNVTIYHLGESITYVNRGGFGSQVIAFLKKSIGGCCGGPSSIFKGRVFYQRINVVDLNKKEVRQQILTLIKSQKEEDRLRKSNIIQEKLLSDPDFVNSKTVLFYASFAGEVDTFGMMQKALDGGKHVVLPVVSVITNEIIPKRIFSLEQDLEYGPYNIKQPKKDVSQDINADQISMVVVPAVAFDRQNNRLGRGAGYYDRFLQSIPKTTPLIGLAFDFQIVERLPVDDHDFPVTKVISN